MNAMITFIQRVLARVVLPLNKPVKRAGFLILIVGILIGASSLFIMNSAWGYGSPPYLHNLLLAATRDYETMHAYGDRRTWAVLAFWGVWLTIAGLFLSYGYDKTIGKLVGYGAKLVAWVRHG